MAKLQRTTSKTLRFSKGSSNLGLGSLDLLLSFELRRGPSPLKTSRNQKFAFMNSTPSSRLWLKVAITLPLLLTSGVLQAHICGPPRIDIKVGKTCLWRVFAD